ncbi:MAG: aminotransferase class III-fold pyridoxal phosphate-dependent enzyme [Burkholderiales bacterium]|nr:aminotransferase class III-fold pyridoxal phosphate-dependent enzyme [Burkholderiales bacterium]
MTINISQLTKEISPFINPDRQFLLNQIKFNKKIKEAKGAYLYPEKGEPILDFLAQYGAVPFGHNPDDLIQIIKDKLDTHSPGFIQPFVTDASRRLAERLINLAPGKFQYAVFTNSGTETVEAAIKLARCATKRHVILSAMNGFHGKTMGAVSATANPVYSKPFLVDTQHFDKVPFDDLTALEQRLQQRDVAAFLIEPIQGESGMRTPASDYISKATVLCHQYNTLIIVDEIQTGLGRTGSLFATEYLADSESIDILLLSKALGGGMIPIGAMLCTKKCWREEFGLYHSSTFSSNGVICDVALASLDKLTNDDAILNNVKVMGGYFKERLQELVHRYPDAYSKVDGKGLMLGLYINTQSWNKSMFTAHAAELGFVPPLISGYLLDKHGILTAPATNKADVLRLEPALTVTKEQIDLAIRALEEAAKLISTSRFWELLGYAVNEKKVSDRSNALEQSKLTVSYGEKFLLDHSKCVGSFAFLIHPLDEQLLFESLPVSIQQNGKKENWLNWIKPWATKFNTPARVKSFPVAGDENGKWIMGHLVASPLTPHQMLHLGKTEREALVDEYIEVAKSLDVDIVGLGAFTSVISKGGKEAVNKGVHITTGNSLTAIASANALIKACKQQKISMACTRVAVIGAAGSIGRIISLHLSAETRHLALFGNPNNPFAQKKLMTIAGEIYWHALQVHQSTKQHELRNYLFNLLGQKKIIELLNDFDQKNYEAFACSINQLFREKLHIAPPISTSIDVEKELGGCQVVISATSAGKSFIDADWLCSGAVVCDVSRPLDFMNIVANKRKDVFVFEGGILSYPQSLKFRTEDVLGFPPGINLACLGETVTLCMQGVRHDYSIGDRLDYQEACEIYDLAISAGFEELIYRSKDKTYTPEHNQMIM